MERHSSRRHGLGASRVPSPSLPGVRGLEGSLLRDLALVIRHEVRIAGRRFADSVRRTLEGKMALIAMLAAPFLMRSMLSSSSLRAVGTDRSGAYTTLAFAHALRGAGATPWEWPHIPLIP